MPFPAAIDRPESLDTRLRGHDGRGAGRGAVGRSDGLRRRVRMLVSLLLAAGLAGGAAADAAPRRVFIAGDSTAAEFGPERAPQAGWGQVLQTYLDPQAYEVRNHARSGRSARSFVEEGWFDAIAQALGEGDVLLIQFGHNDARIESPERYNEPSRAYPQWLMRYVALARERGATPILITPVARRLFEFGSLLDTHARYGDAVRALAADASVALIDLDAVSRDWLRALGDEASKPYFMHVPEQNKADDTHFSLAGATLVACLVVREWKRLDPTLEPHVLRDSDCGAPPDARAILAAQPHPSRVLRGNDVQPVEQPGPHGGPGPTTAYPYFADAADLPFAFRKRVLHKGAGIGLHLHHKDEIYYVLEGRGTYVLDGEAYEVGPADALLTRPGSTHALQQAGDDDLVILIVYPR